MIEADLVAFLTSGLTREVCYQELGSSTVLPCVVVSLDGRDDDHPRVSGAIEYSDFDLDCYADTPLQAVELANELKQLLEGYRGVMGNSRVTLARITNAFDGDDNEGKFYRQLSLSINILND